MHEAWPTDLAWALPPDAGKPIEKLSLASARPRRLRAWLATLSLGEPMADPARGVLPLLRLLEELALLRVDARRRLALLEEVRPGVHQLAQALEADFLNQPLVPPARAAADHARALFEGWPWVTRRWPWRCSRSAWGAGTAGRRHRPAARRRGPGPASVPGLAAVHPGAGRPVAAPAPPARHRRTPRPAGGDRGGPAAARARGLGAPDLRPVVAGGQRPAQPVASSALLALYRAAGHWARWLVLHGDRRQARFRVDPESDQGPRPVAGGDPPGQLYFDPAPGRGAGGRRRRQPARRHSAEPAARGLAGGPGPGPAARGQRRVGFAGRPESGPRRPGARRRRARPAPGALAGPGRGRLPAGLGRRHPGPCAPAARWRCATRTPAPGGWARCVGWPATATALSWAWRCGPPAPGRCGSATAMATPCRCRPCWCPPAWTWTRKPCWCPPPGSAPAPG